MSVCSVGEVVNEECHKTCYGSVSTSLKQLTSLDDITQKLLKLRISNDISTICQYHFKKFVLHYHHLFGTYCSDPLNIHLKRITKDLREIKLENISKISPAYSNVCLIPGKSLCRNCQSKIFVVNPESIPNVSDIDPQDNFVPADETFQRLDSACSILGLSPVSKLRKVSYVKREAAVNTKFKKVKEIIRTTLDSCLSYDDSRKSDRQENIVSSLNEDYINLIAKLKEKCVIASKEEKVKILSLLPDSWTKKQIATEFKVSERFVRLCRNLVKEQGVLPILGQKKGPVGVSKETIEKVQEFFEDDQNSRLCSGMKECKKVIINGEKVTKQKRLLLSNLNELYVHFKNTHPEHKIGRSKFCELRPKWCILAGSSGTHSVCVCIFHQNIKLMIDGAKLNVNYKDLLDVLVCDINNYSCMMSLCKECPDIGIIFEMFKDFEELLPDNLEFKQWVTTDRAEMVTIIKNQDEFFESLVENLANLKSHHYISKIQSQFLKEKKEKLFENECIILADFAENYTYVVQDEIQGYHWVNDQVTLHPFVLYFRDENSKLRSHSLCALSNYLEHNTSVVHVFQSYVVKYIKHNLPKVEKLVYFSDGSGSQYKNKKNFVNICHHQKDFGLKAEWHFFASCHGKNACDGVGGTTKRELSKVSLQRTTTHQILNIDQIYSFCKEKLRGITYFLVKEKEINENIERLKTRYENCLRIKGTRNFHKFCPLSENIIRCYPTSKTDVYEDHCVSKIASLSLEINDTVACVYDEQWWIGKVEEISVENDDVYIHFYHPSGPRTSFQMSACDRVWIPMKNILRKLSGLEMKMSLKGRNYNISTKVSEEISLLLNNHSYSAK